MSQYYFAISSLPHLSYKMETVPDEKQFFDSCESTISGKDQVTLQSAQIFNLEVDKTSNKILEKWYSWETDLRNQLVMLRAAKSKEDPAKYIRGNEEDIEINDTVRNAFESDSPLAAEDILNRARWDFLDDLEFGHYFDFAKLVIYYLKLQLLLRKQSFNKEKGKAKLNKIIDEFSELDIHEINKQNRESA